MDIRNPDSALHTPLVPMASNLLSSQYSSLSPPAGNDIPETDNSIPVPPYIPPINKMVMWISRQRMYAPASNCGRQLRVLVQRSLTASNLTLEMFADQYDGPTTDPTREQALNGPGVTTNINAALDIGLAGQGVFDASEGANGDGGTGAAGPGSTVREAMGTVGVARVETQTAGSGTAWKGAVSRGSISSRRDVCLSICSFAG